MMGAEIKALVVLIMVMIGMNLAILEFAKLGIGIQCPNLSQASYNQTNDTIGWGDIKDLATGRCEGLPLGLFLIIELPFLAGIFFIARKFIGFS